MTRMAKDYEREYGPDADEPAPRIKLSNAQVTMLLRVAQSKEGYELTPGGNRQAALSAANWWRTAKVLEKVGLATLTSAGGGACFRLTAEGQTEANDRLSDTEIFEPDAAPTAPAKSAVEEAREHLVLARRAEEEAEERLLGTPAGDSRLDRLHHESIEAGHQTAQAEEDLRLAEAAQLLADADEPAF